MRLRKRVASLEDRLERMEAGQQRLYAILERFAEKLDAILDRLDRDK